MRRDLVVVSLAIAMLGARSARGETIGAAGVELGYTMLGSQRPTGGATVAPTASYAYRGEAWEVRGKAAVALFGLRDPRWLGVIARTSALVGRRFGPIAVSAGPSLDVYSIPLCAAANACGREGGITWGFDAAVVYAPMDSRVVVGATGHATRIDERAWQGWPMSAGIVGGVAF